MSAEALGKFLRRRLIWCAGLAALAMACTLPAAGQEFAQGWHVQLIALRTATVTLRSGTIPTRDGLELNLNADRGSVLIFTDSDNEIRYLVRAETDPDAAAQVAKQFTLQARKTARGVSLSGQLPGQAPGRGDMAHVWLNYEIHVPRHYSLAISSKAGDIVADDIEGRVDLETGGGNIQAGRVTDGTRGHGQFAAVLQSGGGNIGVGDVSGSLRATTAGGHISAGNVGGDAVIRTDGGHIRVGQVSGDEQLSTGGGNIAAARADDVTAETDGGRVEFGEAAGTIHARTNGGGIRIAHIAAPTEVDSENGAVYLAGIEAPLHASAKNGAIIAWFSPRPARRASSQVVQAGPSDLVSGRGDIVVYLPRTMAVNIDAAIDQSAGHRIIADPALPLKAHLDDSTPGHLHALAAMNGGGSVLHLRTGAGDIQLRLLDNDNQEWLAGLQAALAQQDMLQREFFQEMQQEVGVIMEGSSAATPSRIGAEAGAETPSRASTDPSAIPGGFAGIARLFEGMWRGGGVWVDPDQQQKRLVQAVRPAYPEVAREAGLEGNVTLQVEIGADGAVKDVRSLAGEAELARAATNAVSQWRYSPALLDGRPMSVVTTVTLAFRLR